MAVESLAKFDIAAYRNLEERIFTVGKNIDVYRAQKKTVHNLALLTLGILVIFLAKVIRAKLSGTALLSSSSVALGIFNLMIGAGTLWYLIDGNMKAKQIGIEIKMLMGFPGQKFYGETLERKEDLVTKTEVIESMQQNLAPCFEKPVPMEKSYLLIATNEITLEGDTPDTFKYSSTKIKDNSKEVEAAVAAWREFYAELYDGDSESRTSPIMQAIASQCIQ